jgi:hypothetical protein
MGRRSFFLALSGAAAPPASRKKLLAGVGADPGCTTVSRPWEEPVHLKHALQNTMVRCTDVVDRAFPSLSK